MSRRKRVPLAYDPKDYPDRILRTVAVRAIRGPYREVGPLAGSNGGKLWRLIYALPCPDCSRAHRHGGGDGDQPFMGDGIWTSDCPLAPAFAPLVRLVLAEVAA